MNGNYPIVLQLLGSKTLSWCAGEANWKYTNGFEILKSSGLFSGTGQIF